MSLSPLKLPPHLQHFRGPQGAIMETDHVFPKSIDLMINSNHTQFLMDVEDIESDA
jgi:hypothetical protein